MEKFYETLLHTFLKIFISIFTGVVILGDGPAISKDGGLLNLKSWTPLALNNQQINSLSKTRRFTLNSQQLRLLNIKSKQGQIVKLIDFFEVNDCTCFETFWGIWGEKDKFFVNMRTIKRINKKLLSSDKNIDFKTVSHVDGIESVLWDPPKWMRNNLILSLDGNLYHKGNKLSDSDLRVLRNQSSPGIRIIKLSPKLISLKKQEKWLSKYNIKLHTQYLSQIILP